MITTGHVDADVNAEKKPKPSQTYIEKDPYWADDFTLDFITGTWARLVPKVKRSLPTTAQ